jgi:hypothetical protein
VKRSFVIQGTLFEFQDSDEPPPQCLGVCNRHCGDQLRETAEMQAQEMAARNPTRVHLVEKLAKLVESYTLGTLQVEVFFEALKALIAEMDNEERRAAREGFTEEELAIFDLLTKPEPTAGTRSEGGCARARSQPSVGCETLVFLTQVPAEPSC